MLYIRGNGGSSDPNLPWGSKKELLFFIPSFIAHKRKNEATPSHRRVFPDKPSANTFPDQFLELLLNLLKKNQPQTTPFACLQSSPTTPAHGGASWPWKSKPLSTLSATGPASKSSFLCQQANNGPKPQSDVISAHSYSSQRCQHSQLDHRNI